MISGWIYALIYNHLQKNVFHKRKTIQKGQEPTPEALKMRNWKLTRRARISMIHRQFIQIMDQVLIEFPIIKVRCWPQIALNKLNIFSWKDISNLRSCFRLDHKSQSTPWKMNCMILFQANETTRLRLSRYRKSWTITRMLITRISYWHIIERRHISSWALLTKKTV